MAPVDAYRVHLHLWAYYQQTGEAILQLPDLKNWPKGIGISRKRFQTALNLLCTSQQVRIEKAGKVSYVHLFPRHASLPPSPSF
ncbi:hypothetical protein [Caballeronia udeis]|nr:hypothetical protein [Caballeronia udeis]